MIWVALFLFVVTVVLFLIALSVKEEEYLFAGVSVLVIALVLTVVESTAIVSSGNVGVKLVMGKLDEKALPLEAGIHFPINPFCSIKSMSVRTDTYSMSHKHDDSDKKGDDSIGAISSNGMKMPMDIAIPYKLNESAAPWVYKNLGPNWVDQILRKAAQAAVLKAAGKYTDHEIYSTKRDELSEKIKQEFDNEINKILKTNYTDAPEQVVQVSQILIGNIQIPDAVRIAIENKLKSDQEQQAMDFRILREKKEAERKCIEAEGIQKFQEIVTKGINENLLRWKAIEATETIAASQNAKIIVIGAGKDGLPVLLNGLDK